MSESDTICPQCGCPVLKADSPQQVEVTSVKITQKTKNMIIGTILLCIVCVIGYKIYSNIKIQKAEQAAYEEYINNYNGYLANLKTAQLLMISGGADAEKLCNLTLKVWRNSIYEERDDDTDKYTRPRGYFLDDFNDALSNLFADSETMNMISNIEKNQQSVKTIMKQLQSPPEDLEKCYETISDLYEAYNTLTNLAISPTGNYTSYNSNKTDAASDFLSYYEKLDSQIPNKKSMDAI